MLKKLKQDILRQLGTYFLPKLLDMLCRSLRIEILNKNVIEELESMNKNYVFAFWHGTMLVPWFMQRNKNFAALISKSKDGDILSRVLRYWNYEIVRGSSSTGGDAALETLVNLGKSNKCVAITPDGPRGPANKLKAGAVVAAKKSGIPLILAGAAYKKKRTLKSWDRFEIPGLFARSRIVLSDAVYVDNNLTYDETSEIIKKCEDQLVYLQKLAGEF